ncbi:potassium transporter Kup [Albidovulum sp.]|jgi:KUP system potassium uptake protein|uniref:potassium transporter Kup n=1 Tax=Albidovulum sp. TaxID=1872424 RepID=UPI0039B98D1D
MASPVDATPRPSRHRKPSTAALTFGALGVVYGDIGTSPIYAFRESLVEPARNSLTPVEVLGVISLLVWTLVLVVTLKYVVLILRADNDGEGGILSLFALAQRALGRRTPALLAIAILGMALFAGDAIITPAISVLSAVEALEIVAPGADQVVIPLTLAILAALFWVQRHGTGSVAIFFGPIMLLWFLTVGALGLAAIVRTPAVLAAANPFYAIEFLAEHGFGAMPVMGLVFLAVTGAEALYADLGHFGRRPIRIAWNAVVLPALVLCYGGQGAEVIADPATASNPFFLLAPEGLMLPLVLLATTATVIASQAVISGAFSMAQQAVQLGFLPRLEVQHTSGVQRGQIYLPQINGLIFAGVVALVLSFGSSGRLANAYGIAVTGTMMATTILGLVVSRRLWQWSKLKATFVWVPLLMIELAFFAANITKVAHGGWVPVVLAVLVGFTIRAWIDGSQYVLRKSRSAGVAIETLARSVGRSAHVTEVPGTAVFLTGDRSFAPAALLHNLKHNHVLHRQNLIVTVVTETTPTVPADRRATVEKLDERFTRIVLSFGYMEEPNVPRALKGAAALGVSFDIMRTSFFLSRRSFRSTASEGLPRWQEAIFVVLTKYASNATDFYRLPTNRVLELGEQLAI